MTANSASVTDEALREVGGTGLARHAQEDPKLGIDLL